MRADRVEQRIVGEGQIAKAEIVKRRPLFRASFGAQSGRRERAIASEATASAGI
jgi:hypothetical protein